MQLLKQLTGRKYRLLALYGGVASGDAFLKQFKHPSASLTGQIAALYDIGCLAGSLLSVMICHNLGHRKIILYGSAVAVIGAIIQTSSVNVPMLICGRVIGGIGNGMNTATVPVYHAETSLASSRGKALISELFVNNSGWLVAQFLTLGFSFTKGDVQWRFPTAFQIIFLIPIFVILPVLSDSPRWLASHERLEEATKALGQILDEDVTSLRLLDEMRGIQEVVRLEYTAQKTKVSELWNGQGRNLYRLILACSVQFMAQLGGINIIAYFVVIIFETQLGLSSRISRVLAACAGFGLLASNMTSRAFIERWGRRRLLILGSAGQCICFLVSAIVLSFGGSAVWSGAVVVSMVYLFFIVFAFAWQSIPFLYPAEILSLRYRSRFYGLSNGCNWAINYIIVLVTPMGLANLSWRFFVIFAIFNYVNVLIVYFFVETAQKTLEEVDMFSLESESVSIKPPPFLRLRKAPSHIVFTGSKKSHRASGSGNEKNTSSPLHLEDVSNKQVPILA